MKNRISPQAFALIVGYETGGRRFYEKVYKSAPCWPGGSSGVTIGCGYDLGYESHFYAQWVGVKTPDGAALFTPDQMARLARCKGKVKTQAKQALAGVRDIKIPWECAIEVFNDTSLPVEIMKTFKTFPGAEAKLSANAFGAMVSLVYNRGTDLEGERRREMREIKALIKDAKGSTTAAPDKQLHAGIAAKVKEMARLWKDDPDSDGDLVDRRKDEAKLILTPDTWAGE